MSATVPWPEVSGNRRRMCSVLRALGRLGPVDVFLLTGDVVGEAPASVPVSAVGRGATPTMAATVGERARWLVGRPIVPSELVGMDPTRARTAMRSWIQEQGCDYDVVWFNRAVAHLVAAPLVNGVHVVDLDDLEDQKLRDRLDAGVGEEGVWSGRRWPGWRAVARLKLRRNAAGWRHLQRRIADHSGAVVVCSDEDRERSALPNAIVVPNCHSVPNEPLGRRRSDGAPTFLLIGLMRYRPNADGATWFVHDIWPMVRRAHPTAELRIVGEVADQVRALGDVPGVTVTGRVASVDDELRRADVSVVPIRFGGGTRLKVLESWAHRIPVVSTTRGAAGLGASDGEHLLLADDAASFAEACARVLGEPSLRDRVVAGGAALHEERFACAVVEAQMAADVRRLIGSGRD